MYNPDRKRRGWGRFGTSLVAGATAAEVTERRASVRERDAEAMAFLRFLLAKKPALDAARPAGATGAEEGRTALSLARFWKLDDVAALLQRAGAR